MNIQSKVPKPLLVYFVAFFTYITAGSFISQGCSPPTPTCNPQSENNLFIIPSKLQAVGTTTNCVGTLLVTNPIYLCQVRGWRMRIFVLREVNGTFVQFSSRVYNSNTTPTTTADWQAMVSDTQISLQVPDCGKYKIQISVQRDEVDDCVGGNSNSYMTWLSESDIMQTPHTQYILGADPVANSYIEYAAPGPAF